MLRRMPPPVAPPLASDRAALLARLAEDREHDLLVIGGGASGLGVALDAAARGFDVVLVEAHDFAKGTSSRATKLVHGGVRYLQQGNVALVREALRERAHLLANAPHLAQPLEFVLPTYRWWERAFYGAGLKVYDALAGSAGLGGARMLDRAATLGRLPTLAAANLRGGIAYFDGLFDDARLALALARTAAARGALVVNHTRVVELVHDGARVAGVIAEDAETGNRVAVRARCVVNAAGVWVDGLLAMDARDRAASAPPMLAPSQGVHLVVDRAFLPSTSALIVPRTSDGRVLFAVPWLGSTILGTTDTPRADLPFEPRPLSGEVDLILREAGRYLARAPRREDVKSSWVGLRPLVKPVGRDARDTKAISREHVVRVSRSGLVTVTGGKWTTYRAIAEDVLDCCFDRNLLDRRAGDVTTHLALVGAMHTGTPISAPPGLHLYGAEAALVRSLPGADREIAPGLSEAMVRFAARHEYARTVEDVLARRSRLLFLDAARAGAVADEVARILQAELGRPVETEAFRRLASDYLALDARAQAA